MQETYILILILERRLRWVVEEWTAPLPLSLRCIITHSESFATQNYSGSSMGTKVEKDTKTVSGYSQH
jgi:hypothetical protein